jgi:hypothetical protein
MMNHPYFQQDKFPERFEPEIRQIIDMEKEKEQNERQRRKRAKKVLGFDNSLWKHKEVVLLAKMMKRSTGQRKMKRALRFLLSITRNSITTISRTIALICHL